MSDNQPNSAVNAAMRRAKIYTLLMQQGPLTRQQIIPHFSVANERIRMDLARMEADGLITRDRCEVQTKHIRRWAWRYSTK